MPDPKGEDDEPKPPVVPAPPWPNRPLFCDEPNGLLAVLEFVLLEPNKPPPVLDVFPNTLDVLVVLVLLPNSPPPEAVVLLVFPNRPPPDVFELDPKPVEALLPPNKDDPALVLLFAPNPALVVSFELCEKLCVEVSIGVKLRCVRAISTDMTVCADCNMMQRQFGRRDKEVRIS